MLEDKPAPPALPATAEEEDEEESPFLLLSAPALPLAAGLPGVPMGALLVSPVVLVAPAPTPPCLAAMAAAAAPTRRVEEDVPAPAGPLTLPDLPLEAEAALPLLAARLPAAALAAAVPVLPRGLLLALLALPAVLPMPPVAMPAFSAVALGLLLDIVGMAAWREESGQSLGLWLGNGCCEGGANQRPTGGVPPVPPSQ